MEKNTVFTVKGAINSLLLACCLSCLILCGSVFVAPYQELEEHPSPFFSSMAPYHSDQSALRLGQTWIGLPKKGVCVFFSWAEVLQKTIRCIGPLQCLQGFTQLLWAVGSCR